MRRRGRRRRRMDSRESIHNQKDVALNIGKMLFSEEGLQDKNLVFSSVSVQLLLSIIGAGLKGPTRDQVLSFLRFKTTDDLNSFASRLIADVLSDGSPAGGPRLCFANGVWVQQSIPLNPSFKHLLHTQYKAILASVDFKTKADKVRKEVNSWAKKGTNGLIKEVLPPGSVDRSTRLIYANALYFKGAWKKRFNESITKDYDFHLLNDNSIKVPFMISGKDQFISVFDSFKVLGLPYMQGEDKHQYSMYLFLPDAKVGDFRIPRFKISVGFEISNVLKELGLILPFSNDATDLTEMMDSPMDENMHVSTIFQKSFIDVDEEGTRN